MLKIFLRRFFNRKNGQKSEKRPKSTKSRFWGVMPTDRGPKPVRFGGSSGGSRGGFDGVIGGLRRGSSGVIGGRFGGLRTVFEGSRGASNGSVWRSKFFVLRRFWKYKGGPIMRRRQTHFFSFKYPPDDRFSLSSSCNYREIFDPVSEHVFGGFLDGFGRRSGRFLGCFWTDFFNFFGPKFFLKFEKIFFIFWNFPIFGLLLRFFWNFLQFYFCDDPLAFWRFFTKFFDFFAAGLLFFSY